MGMEMYTLENITHIMPPLILQYVRLVNNSK